ncbi:Signal transduction histidine kinase [Chitinophaga costaii]|uniref:histidine kinase n=1 Tax=Chitinophaga costaii TaxID=1335309 RepID=A0A1C4FCJ8_9BACT|nr:ATP-binding protein [Chitinophaga costaii]PUZ20689.1 hypothetical protein DCM91_18165 [Chitinophaga costaii]SCC53582.1 Signal transduction histidine kinase [Chitinophaga costaii]
MSLIGGILNIGLTDQETDEASAERIRVVNAISALTAVLVIVYGIVFYTISGALGILLPAICMGVGFCAVLYANYLHHYRWAKVGLQCIFATVILYYGIFLGRLANAQLLAVFMISLSLLIFTRQEKIIRAVCVMLPLLGLVVVELNDLFHWYAPLRLTDMQQYIFRWLIMAVVLTLNFLVIYFYQRHFTRLLTAIKLQTATLSYTVEQRTAELQQTVIQLDKSNVSKTIFLQETSHEIRNALHAISGITQLLRHEQQLRPAGGEAYQLIENLSSISNALSEIINNVLELSRIEAGHTSDLHEVCFSLHEWLHSIINIYQYTTRLKKITLLLSIAPTVPPYIIIDRIRLRQVVNNLLTNAIKYTATYKNITLLCFINEGRLCLQVKDEGIGIPREKLEAIFNPFEQAHTPVYGSSGLGLTIAMRMSKMLGGHIQINSQLGEGTTITVSLPLKEGTAAMVEEASTDMLFQPVLQDARILLMEDDPLNQVIMQRMLQQMGVSDIVLVDNGEEGLSLAQTMLPDLIIMDMQMPQLSGWKVIYQIRQDPFLKHIPVLATSANAFKEQKDEALAAGIDEYLTKPIAYDVLYKLLKKHLLQTAFF